MYVHIYNSDQKAATTYQPMLLLPDICRSFLSKLTLYSAKGIAISNCASYLCVLYDLSVNSDYFLKQR
jgi:hypothetical protein